MIWYFANLFIDLDLEKLFFFAELCHNKSSYCDIYFVFFYICWHKHNLYSKT